MMMITEIHSEGKGKCKVCVRGEADFVIYQKEADRFGLNEGEEIPEEVYRNIMEEILIPRATKRAMHILEKMDQTTCQLRDKLTRNGYPEEAVEAALDYVRSYHYLDDERYARNYIRWYQEARSRMRIMQDLQGKGLDKDLICRCLEGDYEMPEEELIRAQLRKKGYTKDRLTVKERDKAFRFLMQRGFQCEKIRRVLREDYEISYGTQDELLT